jgi:hypothetical protein
MKKIISSVMKEKVRDLIKILGIGLHELVIDINIGGVIFNSIEWVEEEEIILLHIFDDDEMDYFIDFEELSTESQIVIYKSLSIIYN